MNKCALIIDDEPAIVSGLQLRVKSIGWRPVSANDGVCGMWLAKEYRPQLIILDMRMPQPDGLQILAQIRSCPETSQIPVVMMSGSTENRQAALDAGANAFLSKPHRRADFLRAISESTMAAPRGTGPEHV